MWLAIDDADRDNACMRYIPGIARSGPSDLHAERNRPEQRAEPDRGRTSEKYGEPVDVELKAGEISIHSDLLLHGSEANQSARRRCGLTLRYRPADVRADWAGMPRAWS